MPILTNNEKTSVRKAMISSTLLSVYESQDLILDSLFAARKIVKIGGSDPEDLLHGLYFY